jgi:hypothetical protein
MVQLEVDDINRYLKENDIFAKVFLSSQIIVLFTMQFFASHIVKCSFMGFIFMHVQSLCCQRLIYCCLFDWNYFATFESSLELVSHISELLLFFFPLMVYCVYGFVGSGHNCLWNGFGQEHP